MHYFWSLFSVVLGFIIEVYTYRIVRTFGHLDWADRYLGAGGSYTAWKIAGIICILFGIYTVIHPF